jgi:Na+-driven multidrug efflux pump
VRASSHLLLALLVVEVANAFARCIAMFLNGIGQVRVQAIFGPAAGLANLALSVWLGRWLGSVGVAWATALCLSVFWLLLMGFTAHRQLRKWNH